MCAVYTTANATIGFNKENLHIWNVKKHALFTLQQKMKFGICKQFENFGSTIFFGFCNLVCT